VRRGACGKSTQHQPIYLQITSFTGHIDGEEDAAVFGGRGDVINPSAAVAAGEFSIIFLPKGNVPNRIVSP
jgi:hypothetical protein